MKICNYLFYFFIIIITSSCSEKNNTDVGESIQNVIEKFPQLKTTKKTFGNDYKLTKSVKNGEFDFEIQLFSEPDSIKGKQEIIVFINSKKECYSIPFFSNKHKDYWQFPFDKEIKNVKKVNSTFSNELNSILNKLTKEEKSKKELLEYKIINELLFSVLNCRNLEERDSILVYKTIFPNSDIPDENHDESFIRLRKNYELMKKEWHPEKYQTNYNCYLDKKNARIYQLNYNNKTKLKVKSYRQDWGFTQLSL
jgi:hypothetical protein